MRPFNSLLHLSLLFSSLVSLCSDSPSTTHIHTSNQHLLRHRGTSQYSLVFLHHINSECCCPYHIENFLPFLHVQRRLTPQNYSYFFFCLQTFTYVFLCKYCSLYIMQSLSLAFYLRFKFYFSPQAYKQTLINFVCSIYLTTLLKSYNKQYV